MKTDAKYLQLNKDILLKIIKEVSDVEDLENVSDETVSKIIRKNTAKDGKTFSKGQIIKAYAGFKKDTKLSTVKGKRFMDLIRMKKVRTLSGVTPVAVLTKPFPCPGKCVYCPNDPEMPKSYLSLEPGAQRALSNNFDPYLQVYNRLTAYKNIGHPTDKIELIVLGGTWSFYPEDYQIWFIKRCFDAMNESDNEERKFKKGRKVKDLEFAKWEDLFSSQKINETARSRCVGLVLETRPDYISQNEVIGLRKLGATKIQIGVQSLNDNILKLNKRGHNVKETAEAFALLRSAGFKIHAHWMPNLLGSTPKEDIKDFEKLFSDERFRPDELKIYPCSLVEKSDLFDYYKKGKWRPYSEKELLYVLGSCLAKTPGYCRITRMVRDISSGDIVVGNKKSNFRQIVEMDVIKKRKKIEEIRFREIKNEKVKTENLSFKEFKYGTKGSKEYFLEYVTKEDKIVAFLRLSIPTNPPFIEELKNSAIIREIHVYGQTLEIGKEEKEKSQHAGLGKNLIAKAVEISKAEGLENLSVISSVGTRGYYSKNGFKNGVLYQKMNIS